MKKLFYALLSVGVFLLLIGAIAILFPSTIWNRPIIASAIRLIDQLDPRTDFRWKTLRVEAARTRWVSHVEIHFDDFCINSRRFGTRGCFTTTRIGFSYDLRTRFPFVSEIGPVQITGGDVDLSRNISEIGRYLRSKEGRENQGSSPRLGDVRVQIHRFALLWGPRPALGELSVRTLAAPEGEKRYEAALQAKAAKIALSSKTIATTASGAIQGPWRIEGNADAELEEGLSLKSIFSGIQKSKKTFSFNARNEIAMEQVNATNTLDLDVELGKSLQGRLIGKTSPKGFRGRFGKTTPTARHDCSFSLTPLEPNRPTKLRFDCPVTADLKGLGKEIEPVLALTGQLRLDSLSAFNRLAMGNVEARIRGFPGQWITSTGSLRSKFSFVPADLPTFEDFALDSDLTLQVPRFEKLVASLRGSLLAVPAPFQKLRGPITFRLDDDPQNDRSLIARVKTDLASDFQIFQTETTVRTALRFPPLQGEEEESLKTFVSIDAMLEEVRLTLPPVGPDSPTRLLPDPRVHVSPIRETLKPGESALASRIANMGIDYRLRVRTLRGAPVELASDMTADPIPLHLDVTSTSRVPAKGTIAIGDFEFRVAGIRRGVRGGPVQIRISEVQQEVRGAVKGRESERPVSVTGQLGGEAGFRPSPKLPLPVIELAASVGLGVPIELAIVEGQRAQGGIRTAVERERTSPQLRHRY